MWRTIFPEQESPVDRHQWNIGSVVPRPIAWITTLNEDGSVNLAPFSFFNAFSSHPPIVAVGIALKPDGSQKDTLINIQRTKEFVVNVVSEELLYPMALTSQPFPYGVSEVEKAGLTLIPSEKLRTPRVEESPIHIECELLEVKQLSDRNFMVIGKVVVWHIRENMLFKGKRPDPRKVKPIARLGRLWYATINKSNVLDVPVPKGLGIGIDGLPDFVRESEELSLNHKALLSMQPHVPEGEPQSKAVVVAIMNSQNAKQEILKYIADLLEQRNVDEAWKVIKFVKDKLS
ncbi:MAG: flavin reductase family protein [Chlorobi bacterium]|nr:flavin reductase family protein [Chlorobiota bacterium]